MWRRDLFKMVKTPSSHVWKHNEKWFFRSVQDIPQSTGKGQVVRIVWTSSTFHYSHVSRQCTSKNLRTPQLTASKSLTKVQVALRVEYQYRYWPSVPSPTTHLPPTYHTPRKRAVRDSQHELAYFCKHLQGRSWLIFIVGCPAYINLLEFNLTLIQAMDGVKIEYCVDSVTDMAKKIKRW